MALFAEHEHLPTYNLEDLNVTSSPLGLGVSEITQSSTVLENHELNDLKSDTIATSISLLPGISQTYYGPNANRPMIRGMGGYRINVLENGLSSFDLSASSDDHAVTINPILVDRIEILRGSNALIHGSNSIGGIVNVFDNSIPNPKNELTYTNEFRIKSSSVDDGINYSGVLFHQEGDFIFQLNGSSISTTNYTTPSFELEEHEHHHHTHYINLANTAINENTEAISGTPGEGEFLPLDENNGEDHDDLVTEINNTQSDVNTFGLGGAYNFSNGYIGLSFSEYESEYGVPNHEESIINIDKEKISLQGMYELDTGYFDQVSFNVTQGDYSHSEDAEHSGPETTLYEYQSVVVNDVETGTFTPHHHDHPEGEEEGEEHHHALFSYEGIDSKVIFNKEDDFSSTALSLGFTDSDMKISGGESYLSAMDHMASENEENEDYVEKNDGVNEIISESSNYRIDNESTRQFGIGIMRKKKLSDSLTVNGGIRYEDIERNYDAFTRAEDPHDAKKIDLARRDNTTNAALGFVSKRSKSITISGNINYSERVPETSELYSSGAHHATESFELGNNELENEESVGLEFSISNDQGDFFQKASFFYNEYDNFIFQSDTGFKTGSDKWRVANDTDVTSANAIKDNKGNPIHLLSAGTYDVDGEYISGSFVKAEFEELSIRQYKGVEAEIYGFEYEFDYKLDSNRYITGFADKVTGNNKTSETSLPRIPPYRIGLSYHHNSGDYSFCLNAIYHGKQDKLGNGEEKTNSYTLLNARLGYTYNKSELYIKVNNLTDTLAFVHTSFLKEGAPLPGRSFEIGYNLKF